jgi:peroxiredoxin Q/BCP
VQGGPPWSLAIVESTAAARKPPSWRARYQIEPAEIFGRRNFLPTLRDIVRNADAALPYGVIGCARTVTKGSTMMTTRIRSSRNLRPALVAAAGIVLSAAFLATLFSDRFAPRIRAAVAADPVSASALLPVGSTAPDFTTVAHDGQKVELSKLKGKWVVLYFYPKDDTTGCTKEACDFRDNWSTLQKKGVAVYGVSTQDNTSHKAFAQKYNLPFPLLPDDKGEIAAKYKVPVVGGVARRITYLIGKDGKIAQVWPAVNPVGHAGEILAQIQPAAKPATTAVKTP